MSERNIQLRCQQPPSFVIKPQIVPNSQKGWARLVKDIVRPPRYTYKQQDLGSSTFCLNSTRYQKSDITVLHQNKKITLTIYQPEYKNNWLILYLHGNSSSRMEALDLLRHLPYKFSLAAFDFLGCGLNQEADTITLGYRQAEQAQSVVKHLQGKGFKIVLWGRSMGAATALRFGQAKIIVADSAFASFKSLCKQIAIRHAPQYAPSCLVSCIFPCVFFKLRQDVKKEADYDIQSLNILGAVQKIKKDTFIIFLSGDQDLLVDKSNSQTLYNSFRGPHKHIEIFKGAHNSKRSETTFKKIMKKIADHVLTSDDMDSLPISKVQIQIQLTEH